MKVRFHGKNNPFYFIDGKEYDVVGKQCGYWAVVDETGEDYLYSPDDFEIVEGNAEELEEIPLGKRSAPQDN